MQNENISVDVDVSQKLIMSVTVNKSGYFMYMKVIQSNPIAVCSVRGNNDVS